MPASTALRYFLQLRLTPGCLSGILGQLGRDICPRSSLGKCCGLVALSRFWDRAIGAPVNIVCCKVILAMSILKCLWKNGSGSRLKPL